MTVRVGVDVGGTFTKAVACDARTSRIVARSVIPTTHASALGPADGVVRAVADVADLVDRNGLGPVVLVAHSTTQAVNALLEGDTATVGILGLGARPHARRAAKRTRVGDVRLAPGRTMTTHHRFVDVTEGIDAAHIRAAIEELVAAGAESLCISQAFGVEDPSAERSALGVAAEIGLPACAGHELTGLYGLEMRTVTGALNSSILPTALVTAGFVQEALGVVITGAPLLVMRGDGGAADLETMRRHPLLTAFSGPAASVAGALRHLSVHDGVVVEVGGTSTNVSTIRRGRPVLAYVRVLDHMTCVRSLDVRVVGVAGGSLVRVRPGRRDPRIIDVGPRSAHIAALPYCSFSTAEELAGAEARIVAPRPGDPEEYLVLETPSGGRFAPTVTCAANALGEAAAGSYAQGDRAAARRGFEAVGRLVGLDADAAARAVLNTAAAKICSVVAELGAEHKLLSPAIVGLGGGAGALVPSVGTALGTRWGIPQDAEVISSVGDALSLVRVELERSLVGAGPSDIARVHREAEEAAVAAGASPSDLVVESEAVTDRRALRVVAVGSAALEVDATLEERRWDEEELRLAAKRALGDEVGLVLRSAFHVVFRTNGRPPERVAVVDFRGSVAFTGEASLLVGSGTEVAMRLGESVPQLTRHVGPVSVAPAVRILRGSRFVDFSVLTDRDQILEAARAECALANGTPVVALLSRS